VNVVVVVNVFMTLPDTFGSCTVPLTWICSSSCLAPLSSSSTSGSLGQLGLSVVNVRFTLRVP